MRKFLFIFFLIIFLSGDFVFAQETVQKPMAPPKNFQDAKEVGKNALIRAKEKLPTIMKQVWEEQIVPFWKKVDIWLKEKILSKMEYHYKEINSKVRERIEKQGPLLKNEVKEKIETGRNSFWARLRAFIESKFGWVFH